MVEHLICNEKMAVRFCLGPHNNEHLICQGYTDPVLRGNEEVISNNFKLGYPVSHNWNFNNTRKVDFILWNPKILLENQSLDS